TVMDIDGSVYPDLDSPPTDLPTDEAKADYVARICAAWDFGILPEPETFTLFASWRGIFERFLVDDSPAFHSFCRRFGWPHGTGRIFKAQYEILDGRDGRTDDYRDLV
ncbi:MAG: hypothetical protein ABI182_05415, partial [Candidatus Baltobacteraceae bacterium]